MPRIGTRNEQRLLRKKSVLPVAVEMARAGGGQLGGHTEMAQGAPNNPRRSATRVFNPAIDGKVATTRSYTSRNHMKRHRALAALVCCFFSIVESSCARQGSRPGDTTGRRVLAIADLNWQQIAALDRQKTLFLLTVGMLEEHGPHLPIATDTIGVDYETKGVADSLRQALPDWQVVLMPTINYGSSGVNQVGNVAIHPGTYGVRQSTLRSLVADIGAQIAQNGFKWVFVLNGHGAPTHHMAVNDACDFVSDAFNATMLNVSALFTADPTIQAEGKAIAARHFSAADVESFGRDQHAGVGETSGVLVTRPDLVDPGYRSLPSQRVENRREMIDTASRRGWPGYFSSPARANSAYGREVEGWWIRGMSSLIFEAVRGENMRSRPRWPEQAETDSAYDQILEYALAPERVFELQFQRWLDQHK
jgi:creatinine amidohydrolase/Fe(II)-dependent formamide hydrolase-like protein